MKQQQALAAFLALSLALLVGTLTPAGEPDAPKNDKVVDEVRKLREDLATMAKTQLLATNATNLELKILGERMERMEKMLKEMSDRSGPTTTTSFRRTVGTVRLVNRMPVVARVTIDGTTYSVPPFEELSVQQPAGPLEYRVSGDGMGVGPTRRTTLAMGGQVRVEIWDPR